MINEAQAIQALKALIPVIGPYNYNEASHPSRTNRIINWRNLPSNRVRKAIKIMKDLDIEYYINRRFGLSVEKHAVVRKNMFKAEAAVYYLSNPPPKLRKFRARIVGREPYEKDPNAPDTLGWKVLEWDNTKQCLISPFRDTEWPSDGMLEDIGIEISEMVENERGIHAALMPMDWKRASHPYGGEDPDEVKAIVERWGKAVVGTKGWRAERVIIKEVLAPNTRIGLAIEQAYPSIIVHYDFVDGE